MAEHISDWRHNEESVERYRRCLCRILWSDIDGPGVVDKSCDDCGDHHASKDNSQFDADSFRDVAILAHDILLLVVRGKLES